MLTNLRDAFRSQSRSPNMVPFDRLGIVFYGDFVPKTHHFRDIRIVRILWPWNQG